MEPSSSRHPRRVRQGPSSDCSGHSCSRSTGFPTNTVPPPTEMSKEEWLKEIERREFYKNYNAMDGAITAIVLGGFFAFVCLLVVYKTKCKPMWKNRRRKLTNTPATQSNAEVDICGGGSSGLPNNGGDHPRRRSNGDLEDEDEGDEEDGEVDRIQRTTSIINSPPILSVTPAAEDFGFECIPLQIGCFSSTSDDDLDLYYLDECGNYLFPLPNETALCSCSGPESSFPNSNHQTHMDLEPRRNSQVSSVSNAYTVKSLPGAYLYIPVVDPKSIGPLGPVKRSLSDPEIHFANPNLGQPLILTVNHPSSELTAKRGSLGAYPSGVLSSFQSRPALLREKKGLPQRSFSIQGGETTAASINIHVTTPTPTLLSPAPSMNSFNGGVVIPLESVEESLGEFAASGEVSRSHNEANGDIINIRNPATSPVSPNSASGGLDRSPSAQVKGANYRRSRGRSLQEHSSSSSLRQRRQRTLRQLTLPVQSGGTHLRVPSGAGRSIHSPQGSISVKRTSSFCSILSEGDGDIFDSQGQLKEDSVFSDQSPALSRSSSVSKRAKHSISDYSDLVGEEFPSEISELPSGPVTLAREEELGEELMERLSGNIPGPEESSSCSGSSLDSETTSIHQFTVPVTIEHLPPGLRSPLHSSDVLSKPPVEAGEAPRGEYAVEDGEEGGGFQLVLVRDIGIQVCGDSPVPSSCSPKSSSSPVTVKSHKESSSPRASSSSSSSSFPSPTNQSDASSSSSSSNHQTDTYVEKFPPEILF